MLARSNSQPFRDVTFDASQRREAISNSRPITQPVRDHVVNPARTPPMGGQKTYHRMCTTSVETCVKRSNQSWSSRADIHRDRPVTVHFSCSLPAICNVKLNLMLNTRRDANANVSLRRWDCEAEHPCLFALIVQSRHAVEWMFKSGVEMIATASWTLRTWVSSKCEGPSSTLYDRSQLNDSRT